jgi:hypothetical protein
MRGSSMKISLAKVTIFILVLGFLLMLAGCSFVSVRPVTIKVLDMETKQPIPGIKVNYVLTKYKPEMGCFLPPGFGVIHLVVIVKKEYTTDEKGEVPIEENNAHLYNCEWLKAEHMFVNIDVDMTEDRLSWYKDKYEFLSQWVPPLFRYQEEPHILTPDARYAGFLLTYQKRRPDHDEQLAVDANYRRAFDKRILDKYDHLLRPVEWEGPAEKIVLELRRR